MLEGTAPPLLLIQTEDLVIHIQGTPGIAKTQVMQQIARLLLRNIYTLIGSIREPVDFYGFPHVVPMVEKEIEAIHGKVAGMNFDRSVAMVSPKWVLDTYTVNSNGGWIVFLDELTCNSAPVQNAMLRVLAEKYVGDTPLAPGTILVSTSNPPNS